MMEGTARNETRKEKPGVSKNYGATQSYRNTLSSNSYLNYYVLRIIFQYLNARDLGSAAMVCRSWSEAANDEKSIRGPCCFSQLYPTCESLQYNIKNIRIKPSAGLFFIADNIPHNIEGLIEDLLPEHCEAITLYCKGYILNDDGIERRLLSTSIICAFLPQIPNVRIKTFKLAEHRIIQKSVEYQEIISTIVDHETSISNHETSTCFMLFCDMTYNGRETAKHWASAMQTSKEVKIASVWGGMLVDMFVRRTYKTEKFSRGNCVAVLITGSIQTWSTILDKKCDTKEQVEARLKLFKDEVKLKKHSIGFMFACVSRGTVMYKEFNVEATIFKRLFPKVPLAVFTSYGYGVFGKTTVDEVNEEKNEEEHKCEKSKSWYNEYSTAFLILTYG